VKRTNCARHEFFAFLAHSCPGRVRRHVRSWRKPTLHFQVHPVATANVLFKDATAMCRANIPRTPEDEVDSLESRGQVVIPRRQGPPPMCTTTEAATHWWTT